MTPAEYYALTGQRQQMMSVEPNFIKPVEVTASPVLEQKGSLTAQDQAPTEKDITKATIAGAAEGGKSGNLGNTLTSAGLYNMLSAGSFTPMGAGLAAGGILLNAADQAHKVDYENAQMRAQQQQQINNAKTQGYYNLMGKNFGMV